MLNEDLARQYQAIVSYVIYSQAIEGAKYMNVASELEVHAGEELKHAPSSPTRSTTSAACRPTHPSP